MLDVKDIVARKDYYITKLNEKNPTYCFEKDVNDVIEAYSEHVSAMKERRHKEAELLYEKCLFLVSKMPNITDEDVPEGVSENENIVLKTYCVPNNDLFFPKDHRDVTFPLFTEKNKSANISGSKFIILEGMLAKIERALINFTLNIANERGFTEFSVPLLVNEETLFCTGHLPKFREDLYQTKNGLFLIPTAEVPLIGMYRDTILEETNLPIRLVSNTPCFRKEAGSSGKNSGGLLRLHQFYKTELVSITTEEDSEKELEHITETAEIILHALDLPYRRVLLCTGETGFSSAKTYDIEVWMPGMGEYVEVSSCSNCRTFQARRAKIRYRTEEDMTKKKFPATLNGSALAIGRLMAAIIENGLSDEGELQIPAELQPFME